MSKTRTQAMIDRQERKVRQHAISRWYKLECPDAFVLRTIMWGTRKVWACTARGTRGKCVWITLWNSVGKVVLRWQL